MPFYEPIVSVKLVLCSPQVSRASAVITLSDFLCYAEQSPQQCSQLKETGQTEGAMGTAHGKLTFGNQVAKTKLS